MMLFGNAASVERQRVSSAQDATKPTVKDAQFTSFADFRIQEVKWLNVLDA